MQVEYAIEAIKLGSTAIGIHTKEGEYSINLASVSKFSLGCVLAVEKRITSPLIVPTSIEKIFEVDKYELLTNDSFNFIFKACWLRHVWSHRRRKNHD